MTDFTSIIGSNQDLPEQDQKKAGYAVKGDIKPEYAAFLRTLIAMLDAGEIRSSDPLSFLKKDIYDSLPQEWKDKVDLSLVNIADQIRLIEGFYRSKDTPDSSPHLETMIAHLWQMKQRIEKEHDVLKF